MSPVRYIQTECPICGADMKTRFVYRQPRYLACEDCKTHRSYQIRWSRRSTEDIRAAQAQLRYKWFQLEAILDKRRAGVRFQPVLGRRKGGANADD